MAPASIVVRLTNQLVAGYETYGFDSSGDFPEVINGVLYGKPLETPDGSIQKDEEGRIEWERAPDFPGDEFYIGGKIVKQIEAEHDAAVAESEKKKDKQDQRPKTRLEGLKEFGVTLDRDPAGSSQPSVRRYFRRREPEHAYAFRPSPVRRVPHLHGRMV